jgi:hypothetical protein
MYKIGKYEIHNWVTDGSGTYRSIVIPTGKWSPDRIRYRISLHQETLDSADGYGCSGYTIWWGPFREVAGKLYQESFFTNIESAKERVDLFLKKFQKLKSFI